MADDDKRFVDVSCPADKHSGQASLTESHKDHVYSATGFLHPYSASTCKYCTSNCRCRLISILFFL